MDETNLGRPSEKVQEAEAAILLRLQELSVLPDNQQEDNRQELEALQKACEELLEIQTQRFNCPSDFAGSGDTK